MYLNRITLIGFLGGDAEKKVSNATNIAVFSLATKTSWKNDAGTWESRTEWHRCVSFGSLAELAGSQDPAIGRDSNGVDRTVCSTQSAKERDIRRAVGKETADAGPRDRVGQNLAIGLPRQGSDPAAENRRPVAERRDHHATVGIGARLHARRLADGAGLLAVVGQENLKFPGSEARWAD